MNNDKSAFNENIKNISIHQEIEVLPANNAKQLKLSWTVREYIGSEIYKFDSDQQIIKEPLIYKDDLQIGMVVAVPTFFGYAKTIIDKNFQATSEGGKWTYILEFDKDDRHCWICSGSINLASIKKLKIYR
jgi:hypothetical protein